MTMLWHATFAVVARAMPNLVFVMVDDWGRFNAGFHGNELAKTPVMDELVREEGMLLDRHYTYKYCSPTRRAFLSGRFPPHSGELNGPDVTLDYRMTSIAERLRARGYATAQYGKWHAGHFSMAQVPTGRGFDMSLGYLTGGEAHWTQQTEGDCGHNTTDLWDTDRPSELNNTGYGDMHYVARAVDFIETAEKPLFCYLALQCAHSPMEAPARFVDETAPAPVEYAMVAVADEAVGNVTKALKKGLWNNTLVVVASDNGGPAFVDQQAASNWPLRGGKYSFLEGGVRATAFVTGGLLPSRLRGTVFYEPVHVCDWYATLLSLAGVPDPADNATDVPPVDSIDQWPVFTGAKLPATGRDIFLATGVLLRDQWKLIATDTGFQKGKGNNTEWSGPLYPQVAAFGDGAKLPCSIATPCLFDVVADPSEFVDLAATRPDIVHTLNQSLASLMADGPFEGAAGTNITLQDVCNASDAQGGYLVPADFA